MKKQCLVLPMFFCMSVCPFFLIAQSGAPRTGPPGPPVRSISEFEPMEGVLIAYPGDFGVPFDLIAEMSTDVIVTTIVENSSDEAIVKSQYSSNNVILSNCRFIQAPVDTYYTRDYGPFIIADNLNEIAIVDMSVFYSPNDNSIPQTISDVLGVGYYYMDMVIQGGNYMTDGMGVAASTSLVFEDNPLLNEDAIRKLSADYLNITTWHIVEDPNSTHIDHIDCWGKFLSVDTILIREVSPSDPQYQDIEETAAYFGNETSSYGTPYNIVRIDTSNDEPYTNSLILNDKVFVPVTGSPNDDKAIRTYSTAMPGYRVFGIAANHNSWDASDAIHCRIKGIPDRNMIYIHHIPLSGTLTAASEYRIEADIISYAGEVIYTDDVRLYYKQDNGSFTDTIMRNTGGTTYSGTITRTTGTEIAYYISTTNAPGRTYTLPYIGEADPFRFTVAASAPTSTPIPSPTPYPGAERGDVNADGAVNIVDALLTAQFYVGLNPAGFDISRADADCDGNIGIVDALIIARYYIGLVTGFC